MDILKDDPSVYFTELAVRDDGSIVAIENESKEKVTDIPDNCIHPLR